MRAAAFLICGLILATAFAVTVMSVTSAQAARQTGSQSNGPAPR